MMMIVTVTNYKLQLQIDEDCYSYKLMTKIVDQVRDCDTVATISSALAKVKILSETFQSFPLLYIIFVNLPKIIHL